MIKYLFFDNDGVLVDTEKYFFEATRIVLAQNGIELTKEKFIELTLIGNEGGWRLARDMNMSEAKIDLMRKERNELYSEYLSKGNLLADGADEVIENLAAEYKLGIVTSSKKTHFDLIHKSTGILNYFSFVLTREDYTKSKPAADPYLKALETAGCAPDEAVSIEDSLRGLVSSNGAGIKCIIIPNELTAGSDFKDAWKIIDNIKQLAEIL